MAGKTFPTNHAKGLGYVANKETTPKTDFVKSLDYINRKFLNEQVVAEVNGYCLVDCNYNRSYKLILKGNSYQVNIKNLEAGKKLFIVVEPGPFQIGFVGVSIPDKFDFFAQNTTLYTFEGSSSSGIVLVDKKYNLYGKTEGEFTTEEFSSGDILV